MLGKIWRLCWSRNYDDTSAITALGLRIYRTGKRNTEFKEKTGKYENIGLIASEFRTRHVKMGTWGSAAPPNLFFPQKNSLAPTPQKCCWLYELFRGWKIKKDLRMRGGGCKRLFWSARRQWLRQCWRRMELLRRAKFVCWEWTTFWLGRGHSWEDWALTL